MENVRNWGEPLFLDPLENIDGEYSWLTKMLINLTPWNLLNLVLVKCDIIFTSRVKNMKPIIDTGHPWMT